MRRRYLRWMYASYKTRQCSSAAIFIAVCFYCDLLKVRQRVRRQRVRLGEKIDNNA